MYFDNMKMIIWVMFSKKSEVKYNFSIAMDDLLDNDIPKYI